MKPKTANTGRYSKVYRRKWVDEKVKALGAPPPHPFTLLDRFMTGTELTNVPGLFPAWEGGLANALKWSLEDFRIAFAKVYELGFVEADWDSGLVWMKNAIRYNEPESPKVVIGWAKTIQELPECALKEKALAHFRAYFEAKGTKKEPWVKAFEKACGKPLGKPSRKGYSQPIGNQEQEQEQDTRSLPVNSLAKDLTGGAQGDTEEPAAPSELELPTFEVEFPDSDASLPPVASDPPAPASDGAPRVTETRLRATSRELPAHVRNFERSMSGQSTKSAEAVALFDAYRDESGKTGARYDHKARDLFERLVDEGETQESVREVVRGAKLDSWARDTAKLAAAPLLSSSDQRVKFASIARNPPRAAGVKAPPQPNDPNNRYDPRKSAGVRVI